MTGKIKLMLALLALCVTFLSCNNNSSPLVTTTDSSGMATVQNDGDTVSFISPIKFKNWEMGDAANINTILKFYLHWDERSIDSLAEIFGDTIVLRIPTERTEIILPHDKVARALKTNQKQYSTTDNQIISAISVHEKDTNTDWVMITAYSKWTELNGKPDSLLYHDDWQIKNGKVVLLTSFQKLPIKHFLDKPRGGF